MDTDTEKMSDEEFLDWLERQVDIPMSPEVQVRTQMISNGLPRTHQVVPRHTFHLQQHPSVYAQYLREKMIDRVAARITQ